MNLNLSENFDYRWSAMALTMVFMLTGCAPTQSSSDVVATVETVTVTDGGVAFASTPSALMLAQVQEMSDEIGTLRDRVEILEFELDKSSQRQKQLYDDLDQRLRKFERRDNSLNSTPSQPQTGSATQPDSTDPTDSTDEGSPDTTGGVEPVAVELPASDVNSQVVREVYDNAFRALRQGRYEDSIIEFQALIDTYPNSELVDDALYWIAEANYVTQKHDLALPVFERVIREFPENQRAAEAMLKIGYIYYDQQNYEEAKIYLMEVIDRFPASRSAFSARRRLDKMGRDGVL